MDRVSRQQVLLKNRVRARGRWELHTVRKWKDYKGRQQGLVHVNPACFAPLGKTGSHPSRDETLFLLQLLAGSLGFRWNNQ